MLPQLSCLSVRNCPETRLRHWCSSRYLRISLLHREFQSPLQSSSDVVSDDLSGLGPELSHQTYATTYAPFTPSESEQRLGPLYYRGCWHRVSRPFLFRYYQSSRLFTCSLCSRMTGVYEPKPFIPHAASLHQGCPHCERFRLLPPVGVWTVSQFQCGWSSSQTSYPSSPWWAVTSPTS